MTDKTNKDLKDNHITPLVQACTDRKHKLRRAEAKLESSLQMILTLEEAMKIAIENQCDGCGLTTISLDIGEALASLSEWRKTQAGDE